MKIAIFSTIQEIVPPAQYGGTELIVSQLVEALVRRGHDVTLFARAESTTTAKLVSLNIGADDVTNADKRYISTYLLAAELARQSGNFDIIHSHNAWRFLPFASKMKAPLLVTSHNMYTEKLNPIFSLYNDVPFTSISNDQRKNAPPDMQFVATVYNGIDIEKYTYTEESDEYMVWLGRIIEKKGVKEAIEIAVATGRKLKIAGPFIEDTEGDRAYGLLIKELIAKHADVVEYVGMVGGKDKYDLISRAKVLLHPISWDEPFGLVGPEANASGVPFVAFNRGATVELLRDGVNGYLIEPNNLGSMIEAVQKIYALSPDHYREMRKNARAFVEEHFTIERMVDGYEAAYKKVLEQH